MRIQQRDAALGHSIQRDRPLVDPKLLGAVETCDQAAAQLARHPGRMVIATVCQPLDPNLRAGDRKIPTARAEMNGVLMTEPARRVPRLILSGQATA